MSQWLIVCLCSDHRARKFCWLSALSPSLSYESPFPFPVRGNSCSSHSLCLYCRNIYSLLKLGLPLWNSLWLCWLFSDSQLQTMVRPSSYNFQFMQGLQDGQLLGRTGLGVRRRDSVEVLPPAQESWQSQNPRSHFGMSGRSLRTLWPPPPNVLKSTSKCGSHFYGKQSTPKKNIPKVIKARQLLSLDLTSLVRMSCSTLVQDKLS